jgi:hypothetical protein
MGNEGFKWASVGTAELAMRDDLIELISSNKQHTCRLDSQYRSRLEYRQRNQLQTLGCIALNTRVVHHYMSMRLPLLAVM